MSLSIQPTRPFGHSDLPAPPPAPAASPRLRRAAGKEGRLAPPHLPPLPAAAPRASPDRNVLMYLRTGSAGPTQPAARIVGRRHICGSRASLVELEGPGETHGLAGRELRGLGRSFHACSTRRSRELARHTGRRDPASLGH